MYGYMCMNCVREEKERIFPSKKAPVKTEETEVVEETSEEEQPEDKVSDTIGQRTSQSESQDSS
jgi:hypothetical protein